ncbi:hypothetical protein K493DRAFT_361652 [Basidiobolus meristosporus CBS 931.73]|uniref:Uncharacterized protein n=1 Tax=Basidiobolus meristosporus CBS 931.73 TaxID=1314790 RepID=A0A1Y1X966_9FUNG|nr:hypothetical protein K493DRAFT_361652 [Basidiobolus meristosporus CBS 931.73]|eukprot:ORX81884.1 hypothetical protein K493DRAFT_361652 [Basidiobolus meristosporus CBS 931.73]
MLTFFIRHTHRRTHNAIQNRSLLLNRGTANPHINLGSYQLVTCEPVDTASIASGPPSTFAKAIRYPSIQDCNRKRNRIATITSKQPKIHIAKYGKEVTVGAIKCNATPVASTIPSIPPPTSVTTVAAVTSSSPLGLFRIALLFLDSLVGVLRIRESLVENIS